MGQKRTHQRRHLLVYVLLLIGLFLGPALFPASARESLPTDGPRCSEKRPAYKLTPKQLAISLSAQARIQSRVGDRIIRQESRDLDTLYAKAAEADVEVRRITRSIAEQTGGTAVFPPGGRLKGRQRADEKILVELGGDASGLMDIARSSIGYATVDKVYQALQFILYNGYDIVRMKDRALDPLATGFWNIHLNIRMSNRHIVELQLQLMEILRYSLGEGHKLYEQVRGIEADAVREGRSLTPEEMARIDELNQEQRRFYEAAFQRGQAGIRGIAD